jgi:hypothetical protein
MELKEVMNVMQVSGERIPSGYYKKPEVDAVIAEKDAEIAELKQKLDKAIAERDGNQVCIDALKKKLENVQASMYCDVVDANMENRRLKRALWIARAYFCGRSSEYFSGMASRCKIGQEDFYKKVSEKAQRYLKASYKCRAKAEEYK